MDPSKLPSMSRTPRPGPPTGASGPPVDGALSGDGPAETPTGDPSPAGPVGYAAPPPDVGAAWLSAAIGLILLFVLNGPRNLLALATDPSTLKFTDVDGSPLGYTATAFFWTDLGVTAFALLLLAEAAALSILRGRGASTALLGAAGVVALFNLAVIPVAVGKVGFPLMNAVAAAFAVYVGLQEWGRLRSAAAPGATLAGRRA